MRSACTEQVLTGWGIQGDPEVRHPLTPASAGRDLPSASSGAHPGGTAPPSSGIEVRFPSLAAAPGIMGARLIQGQKPGLPSPLHHAGWLLLASGPSNAALNMH